MVNLLMARLAGKMGYQKDTCYNETGLCAQKMLSILGSQVNIIGRPM